MSEATGPSSGATPATGATGAAERLRRAVHQAVGGAGSKDDVEAAARTLVAELRGEQRPPERVLVLIKALLADAGLSAGAASADASSGHGGGLPGAGQRDRHATLYRDIITLSIRCYYEDACR